VTSPLDQQILRRPVLVPSSEADYCRFDRHPPRFQTQSARVVSAVDRFRILSAHSRRLCRTSSGYCSFAYSALASLRMVLKRREPQERPKSHPMEPQVFHGDGLAAVPAPSV
jgi:hypothetical protein